MMNNSKLMKILACVLCITVLCASSAAVAYAVGAKNAESTEKTEKTEAAANETSEKTEAAATKDETVYVIAGADGSVKKVIVSDWIKNNAKSSTLTDAGELADVTNVKGDESYTMNSDNMRVWNADGSDIYSTGTSDKSLPVDIALSYTLDGKKISPEELAGKSGRVTIRFDYTNNLYETAVIGGEEQTVYIPFVMLTGMILDNDNFTDIEVTNARIINDGSRCIVCGLALPGLQSDLDIAKEDMELPDYVEISADVSEFELETTLTLATNEIFSNIDLSKTDNTVDELKSSMTTLTDAMSSLLNGSSQLYDGLSTLLDKSGELVAGVNQLSDGAAALKAGSGELSDGSATLAEKTGEAAEGAAKLASGASDAANGSAELAEGAAKLAEGTGKLSEGTSKVSAGADTLAGYTAQIAGGTEKLFSALSTVSGYSDTMRSGAATVYNTLLTTVHDQIGAGLAAQNVPATVPALTIENYHTVLEGVKAQLSDENAKALVFATVLSGYLEQNGMTKEMYDSLDAGTKAAINAGVENMINTTPAIQTQLTAALTAAAEGRTAIDSAITQLDTYGQFYMLVNQYSKGVDEVAGSADSQKLKAGIGEVNVGMQALAEGAKEAAVGANDAKNGAAELAEGAAKLADGTKTLSAGTDTLANGSAAIAKGAATLASGARDLDSGALTLKNGILSLKSSCPTLVSGVTQLKDGAMLLNNGLSQFNSEGVQKLVGLADDADAMLERVRAIVNVSKDYQSFTGLGEDMDGSVRYIYKTDSIG